jgi:hypothetical protein
MYTAEVEAQNARGLQEKNLLFVETTGVTTDGAAPAIPSEHMPLWRKLVMFPLDNPQHSKSYCRKLAKNLLVLVHDIPRLAPALPNDADEQQRWAYEMARRVVGEYKRFLLLAAVVGTVTPSLMVDEAWHLHLQYTRSYWKKLCADILGRELHHNPGTGDEVEESGYAKIYQRTLDAYASFWGEPPIDIWGAREAASCQARTPNAQRLD